MSRPLKVCPDTPRLVASYQAGRSTLILASEYAVCVNVVCRWLADAGVKLRPRGRRPGVKSGPRAATVVSNAKLAAAYHGGSTLRQVGREFGVSHEWVRQAVLSSGTVLRSRGYRSGPAA